MTPEEFLAEYNGTIWRVPDAEDKPMMFEKLEVGYSDEHSCETANFNIKGYSNTDNPNTKTARLTVFVPADPEEEGAVWHCVLSENIDVNNNLTNTIYNGEFSSDGRKVVFNKDSEEDWWELKALGITAEKLRIMMAPLKNLIDEEPEVVEIIHDAAAAGGGIGGQEVNAGNTGVNVNDLAIVPVTDYNALAPAHNAASIDVLCRLDHLHQYCWHDNVNVNNCIKECSADVLGLGQNYAAVDIAAAYESRIRDFGFSAISKYSIEAAYAWLTQSEAYYVERDTGVVNCFKYMRGGAFFCNL